MDTVIHKSSDRGHANHGWLDTHHTFSFAGWYNPEQMHFGVLRVLNDDIVQPSNGFGQHPHNDMEIISIPLSGSLTHRDTMGNAQEIKTGDVQVMSAGSGLQHSEFNESRSDAVNFLQLWIFPDKRGVEPRYDQETFEVSERQDKWQQLVRPHSEEGEGLWIHQNAYLSRADISAEKSLNYEVKSEGNGVYFFVLEGSAVIAGKSMNKRDGIGVWETSEITIEASEDTQLLAVEVPMDLPQY